MENIAIYTRVSTSQQTNENQKLVLEKFCKSQKMRFEVFEEVQSSRNTRPIKKKLLDDLRKRKYDGVIVYKLDRWDIIGDLAAVAQGAVASYVTYVILITSVSLLAVYGLVGYVVHLAVQEWYLPAHATDEAVHAEQLTRAHGAAMHAKRQQGKEPEEDPEPLGQSSTTTPTPGVEDQQPEQEEQEPCGPAAESPPRSSTWQRLPMPARRFLIQFAIQLVAVLVLFFFTHGTYLINGASIKGGEPMVIGHRGVWTTAPGMERVPENSFEACDHAKKYGFHGCEFDVRMTKDKKLVVMHDHTLQRTTTATTGNVDEFTLAELKQLTLTTDQGVPSKTGETVPTLREYLDYIKSIGMIAEVELKQGYDKEIMVAAALDDICRAGMQNMSFMATCEYHYQSILRTIAPDISLERDYLYHTPAGSNNVPTNANILGISNLFLLFNPWVVANSHQAGAGVMVYFVTIENSWLVTFALNLGVDYLMINEGASCIGSGVCPTKKPYKLSRYLKYTMAYAARGFRPLLAAALYNRWQLLVQGPTGTAKPPPTASSTCTSSTLAIIDHQHHRAPATTSTIMLR